MSFMSEPIPSLSIRGVKVSAMAAVTAALRAA